jgi:hypothetical protein
LMEGLVLAFEVQHGHRLGGGLKRFRLGGHNSMLAAAWSQESQKRDGTAGGIAAKMTVNGLEKKIE